MDSDSGMDFAPKKLPKELLSKLHRVTLTIYEMLHDRGYLIFEEDLNITLKQFKKQFKSPDLHKIVATHSENPAKRIVVKYHHIDYNSDDQKTPSLSKPTLYGHIGSLDEDAYPDRSQAITSLIIVTNCDISPSAKQLVGPTAGANGKGSVEIFKEGELMVNITDHSLAASFVLLDSYQKQDVLKKLRIEESQIPRIGVEDSISRYFCAKQGDLFKIVRKSDHAGRYLYYRLVQ